MVENPPLFPDESPSVSEAEEPRALARPAATDARPDAADTRSLVVDPHVAPSSTGSAPYLRQDFLKPDKTFRIAVSGDVFLTRLEVQVVDSPAFQRLRRIRQLGTTAIVYPSAQHTRFEHSLGCLFVANTMMDLIGRNEYSSRAEKCISFEERALTRLVALLHDIGNLPFGHTLEDETHVVTSSQDSRARYEYFLAEGTPLGTLLHRELGPELHFLLLTILSSHRDDVARLGDFAFIYDLVKNTVCADLLDYLRRDAYFCNLQLDFGTRFLNYLHLADRREAEGRSRRLAIRLWREKDDEPRPDLLSELIQLLQSRYYLAERVYFHHSKIIAGAMLGHAVHLALEEGPPKRRLTLNKLLEIGDDELLADLAGRPNADVSALGSALLNRELFKRQYSLSRGRVIEDKREGLLDSLEELYHESPTGRLATQTALAERCGLEPNRILIYCPNPNMSRKEAEMLVTWRDDIRPLREIDDRLAAEKIASILDSHKALWKLQVLVHPAAALQDRGQATDKAALLRRWCEYEFEAAQRKPDPRGLIRDTMIDVCRDANYVFSAEQLDVVATQFSNPARGLGELRGSLEEYARAKFQRVPKPVEGA